MKITLGQLADHIGAELVAGASGATAETEVERLSSLADAGAGSLSFLSNPKYADQLATTKATAVIVGKASVVTLGTAPVALLHVDNPDLAFAKASLLVCPPPPAPAPGIHPSAVVSPSAKIGRGVSIGACAVIEDGAVIGDGCVLFPQTYIGNGSTIGDGCLLYAGVKIYHQVTVGRGCIFHSGAVIGSDGFGFVWTGQGFYKVPQVGTVVVEDGVEIGANTCIDRARFGETHIGAGTKLDNLIQIAHNVKLGKCCAFAAQVGLAGSTEVGNGVQMGGQAGTAGHIKIGDGLTIVGKSGVTKSLPGRESGVDADKLIWIQNPAKPMKEQLEEWRNLKSVGRLRRTVKELEDRINKLESERS